VFSLSISILQLKEKLIYSPQLLILISLSILFVLCHGMFRCGKSVIVSSLIMVSGKQINSIFLGHVFIVYDAVRQLMKLTQEKLVRRYCLQPCLNGNGTCKSKQRNAIKRLQNSYHVGLLCFLFEDESENVERIFHNFLFLFTSKTKRFSRFDILPSRLCYQRRLWPIKMSFEIVHSSCLSSSSVIIAQCTKRLPWKSSLRVFDLSIFSMHEATKSRIFFMHAILINFR
jgi:hypothetical protein